MEIEHYKEALNQAIIDELQDAREEFIHLSNSIDIRVGRGRDYSIIVAKEMSKLDFDQSSLQ